MINFYKKFDHFLPILFNKLARLPYKVMPFLEENVVEQLIVKNEKALFYIVDQYGGIKTIECNCY